MSLFVGLTAFAQPDLTPERRALIRKVARPVLLDTLNYCMRHLSAFSDENAYNNTSVSAAASMGYALDDDYLHIVWPAKVVVNSVDENGRSISHSAIKNWNFSALTMQCNMLGRLVGGEFSSDGPTDPLIAWLIYVGGYRILEEVVFPKEINAGTKGFISWDLMVVDKPLRETVLEQLPVHNLKAESSGRIWEITAFDEDSLTLRAAVEGGGPATLQKAWEADPYALVFSLVFDMGIHFYLYDSTQAAAPQEAFFSAAEVVDAVKKMK